MFQFHRSFRHSGQRSAASFLTGGDTPLLDYKRGVLVAQPRVEGGNILLRVLWNCSLRQLGPGSADGFLTGTGTPLLDYKGGVLVAQTRVEVGEERSRSQKVISTLIIISITHSVNRIGQAAVRTGKNKSIFILIYCK
jgi:hypothetical protein